MDRIDTRDVWVAGSQSIDPATILLDYQFLLPRLRPSTRKSGRVQCLPLASPTCHLKIAKKDKIPFQIFERDIDESPSGVQSLTRLW